MDHFCFQVKKFKNSRGVGACRSPPFSGGGMWEPPNSGNSETRVSPSFVERGALGNVSHGAPQAPGCGKRSGRAPDPGRRVPVEHWKILYKLIYCSRLSRSGLVEFQLQANIDGYFIVGLNILTMLSHCVPPFLPPPFVSRNYLEWFLFSLPTHQL